MGHMQVSSPIIRKGRSDVKQRLTEAQIIGFQREAEAGLPVKDLCRRTGSRRPVTTSGGASSAGIDLPGFFGPLITGE